MLNLLVVILLVSGCVSKNKTGVIQSGVTGTQYDLAGLDLNGVDIAHWIITNSGGETPYTIQGRQFVFEYLSITNQVPQAYSLQISTDDEVMSLACSTSQTYT